MISVTVDMSRWTDLLERANREMPGAISRAKNRRAARCPKFATPPKKSPAKPGTTKPQPAIAAWQYYFSLCRPSLAIAAAATVVAAYRKMPASAVSRCRARNHSCCP